MATLLLYVLLSSAFFYLGSRALITRWLWSRYPAGLVGFMDCAACTGFWYGFLSALTLGRSQNLALFDLAADAWVTPPIVGLCTLVLTPIVAGLMQRGLDSLGSVVQPDDQQPHHE